MSKDVEQILSKYEDWEDVLGRPLGEIVADLKEVDGDALSLVSGDDEQSLQSGLVLLRGRHTQRLLEALNDEINRIRAEESSTPASKTLH